MTADPAGGPLSLGAEPGAFDVFDWGGGAYALRAAATGRFVSVDDGVLVNDQPGPNGWEVRQTFRMEERPRGAVALRHISTGCYVGAAGDGTLRLVDDADQALWLVLEVISSGARQAAELAAAADVAVVVVGDHPLVNGRETEDRSTLALAPAQDALVAAVLAANPRTVMVISSGCPLTWTASGVPAVLWSAHGGQEYGHALAEVLLGDAAPEGRLTQTWYRSEQELPDLLDYDIITADATYMYFRGIPRYPFGHGLGYADFGYSGLAVEVDGEMIRAEVTVTNLGEREGAEVVQFYTHQQRSRVKQPLRRLRGFEKVRLAPGESRAVRLDLPVRELACWDVTSGRFVVERAPHRLMAGRSATDLRVAARFEVDGETIPPRRGPLRAVDHDEYDAITFTDAGRESGDAVRADTEGSWILFRQVELTGVASCLAVLGSTEGGMITLRTGDPLYGPPVATLPVPRTGRYDLHAIATSFAAAGGVHDLYVVFENEGVILSQIDFGAAT